VYALKEFETIVISFESEHLSGVFGNTLNTVSVLIQLAFQNQKPSAQPEFSGTIDLRFRVLTTFLRNFNGKELS